MKTGRELGAKNVGRLAIDCLRIDRVVPKMGSELTPFISPWETGLGDRVHLEKVRIENKLILNITICSPSPPPVAFAATSSSNRSPLFSSNKPSLALLGVIFLEKTSRGALLGMIETWILFTVIWKVNLIVEKLLFR